MTITTTIERCAFCGEIVSFDDADVLQLHGGPSGFAHESCLDECAADVIETESK